MILTVHQVGCDECPAVFAPNNCALTAAQVRAAAQTAGWTMVTTRKHRNAYISDRCPSCTKEARK